MQDVESYIQELRTKAIDMLGDSLFYKVYDLVSTYMDSNIDGNDLKNSSFLHVMIAYFLLPTLTTVNLTGTGEYFV